MSQASSTSDKLRKACNECNAAKVRCSGQRTGCDRCRSVNASCIYAISRVGKVSGIRSRRKDSRSSNDRRQSPNALASPALTIDDDRTTRAVEHQRALHGKRQRDEDLSVQLAPKTNWPTPLRDLEQREAPSDNMRSFFEEPFDAGISQLPIQTQSEYEFAPSVDSFENNLTGLSMDLDFGDMHDHPSATPEFFHEQPSQANRSRLSLPRADSATASQDTQESRVNSQCIVACCFIMVTLENFIGERVQMFDLIVDHAQKATTSLQQIVEQRPRSQRCYRLLTVALEQVIMILDRGLSLIVEEEDRPQDQAADVRIKSLSDIIFKSGFGSFAHDTSEQRAWRARGIFKEVQKADQVWQRVQDLYGHPLSSNGMVDGTLPLSTKLEQLSEKLKQLQQA